MNHPFISLEEAPKTAYTKTTSHQPGDEILELFAFIVKGALKDLRSNGRRTRKRAQEYLNGDKFREHMHLCGADPDQVLAACRAHGHPIDEDPTPFSKLLKLARRVKTSTVHKPPTINFAPENENPMQEHRAF